MNNNFITDLAYFTTSLNGTQEKYFNEHILFPIEEENEQLKQDKEKMKCCENCKHGKGIDYCKIYELQKICICMDKWELAE